MTQSSREGERDVRVSLLSYVSLARHTVRTRYYVSYYLRGLVTQLLTFVLVTNIVTTLVVLLCTHFCFDWFNGEGTKPTLGRLFACRGELSEAREHFCKPMAGQERGRSRGGGRGEEREVVGRARRWGCSFMPGCARLACDAVSG